MLADILNDGMKQGLFETPFPLECMEMVVSYLDIALDDDVFELTEEQRSYKIKAFIFNLERLLGVENGQFDFVRQMFGGEKGEE